MRSNLDPFRCLFGGLGLPTDPKEPKYLHFDVLGRFWVYFRREFKIFLQNLLVLGNGFRAVAARESGSNFRLLRPFFGHCASARCFDFMHATQDR